MALVAHALSVAQQAHGLAVSFAVEVPARKTECFYFPLDAKIHGNVHVEFLVSNAGDKRINAYVRDPNGNVIERKSMIEEDVFLIQPLQKTIADQDWAYAVCLDNTFSSLTSKLVDIDVWGDGDDDEDYPYETENADPHGIAEKVSDLEMSASDMRQSFRDIFRSQAYLRHRGLRHQSTAEVIHWKVDMWSILFMTLEIGVPFAQVIFVRNLLSNAGGAGHKMGGMVKGPSISF